MCIRDREIDCNDADEIINSIKNPKWRFGIQLIAPAGNDAKLSEIALAIEDALSNHEETKRAIPDIV